MKTSTIIYSVIGLVLVYVLYMAWQNANNASASGSSSNSSGGLLSGLSNALGGGSILSGLTGGSTYSTSTDSDPDDDSL